VSEDLRPGQLLERVWTLLDRYCGARLVCTKCIIVCKWSCTRSATSATDRRDAWSAINEAAGRNSCWRPWKHVSPSVSSWMTRLQSDFTGWIVVEPTDRFCPARWWTLKISGFLWRHNSRQWQNYGLLARNERRLTDLAIQHHLLLFHFLDQVTRGFVCIIICTMKYHHLISIKIRTPVTVIKFIQCRMIVTLEVLAADKISVRWKRKPEWIWVLSRDRESLIRTIYDSEF